MIIYRYIICVLTILLIGQYGISQDSDFSDSSIKIGVGLGVSIGNSSEGLGLMYSIGYQKEIWNSRWRLNPYFSIGHYSSRFITDTRDLYFNSLTIGANLYFDLIRLNSFSIVIVGGGLINNARGLLGTGGDPEGGTLPKHSRYLNEFHLGGYLGGGFRVNRSHKRTALSVMPFNLRYGTNGFFEFHPTIELEFKL